MDFDTAVAEFLGDQRTAGRAARTVGQHEYELKHYRRWLELERLDWRTIERRQIKPYLSLRAHLGFSSRVSQISTLRVFYRWCVAEGYLTSSPAEFTNPARPQPVPRSLTTTQIRQLVAHLQAADGRTAQRDAALLFTALYTGFRASELAGLCWPFVDLDGSIITITLAKMNHGRAVTLHSELRDVLTRWRELQSLDQAAPVFSLDGTTINGQRVGKVARRYAKLLDLPLTAHVLRHTFGTQAYLHSRDIYAVSKALGHKHIKQTEIYVLAAASASAPAVTSLPDRDSW